MIHIDGEEADYGTYLSYSYTSYLQKRRIRVHFSWRRGCLLYVTYLEEEPIMRNVLAREEADYETCLRREKTDYVTCLTGISFRLLYMSGLEKGRIKMRVLLEKRQIIEHVLSGEEVDFDTFLIWRRGVI